MRTIGWLLILACAGSLRVRAQEGGGDIPVTAILARETAWSEAESRGDNGALERIFDNAVVYIEDGSLLTKGEYLSRVRLADARPRQVVAGAATVRVFGSTAIVVGTYREIGVKVGRSRQGGGALLIPG